MNALRIIFAGVFLKLILPIGILLVLIAFFF